MKMERVNHDDIDKGGFMIAVRWRKRGQCWAKRLGTGCTAVVLAAFLLAVPAEAVESGRLVEKDGRYVFIENMDPSMKLLLDRSLQNGLITQEEYDNAIKESEERAYLTQSPFRAWYDRGFNFSMND